ncbi:hypothetical protein LB504_010201 [Fusarium proliferatum]|nr:hypothetical protein LB504_010201 [Fusarium proliferatum]
MLFSVRSLDGSLGGMMNSIAPMLQLALVFGNGKNKEGQGNERNGLDIRPRMVAIIYVLASITVLINIYYADAKSRLYASLWLTTG